MLIVYTVNEMWTNHALNILISRLLNARGMKSRIKSLNNRTNLT